MSGAGRTSRQSGPAQSATARATYRGVRWQRSDAGAIAWFNSDSSRWVPWRPGGDQPPLPPKWAAEDPPVVAGWRSRSGWRSPYRLVPIVLVAGVVIIAVAQANSAATNLPAKERAAAEKLLGHCLARKGTVAGHPSYTPAAVGCGEASASVKVVSVLPGTPGGPHCPAGTSPVQFAYSGVRYPHIECLMSVTGDQSG